MRRYVVLSLAALVALPAAFAADKSEDAELKKTREVTAKIAPKVEKGLNWLAGKQQRDGRWEAQNGSHPIAMTALAGIALMAEGSTSAQGKYSKNIDLAVDYLVSRVQKSGLIGNPNDEREKQRYMYGHGFSMMFLAQVYGEESDIQRRRELEKILTRAVEFTVKAATKQGGFGYVSAADGSDFDEGSVTITQVQALRACRNSGVPVPKKVIEDCQEYLKKSTVPAPGSNENDPLKRKAGVIYSLKNGGGGIRAPLTAAAVACSFGFGDYKSELAMQWINYLGEYLPLDGAAVAGGGAGRANVHWEYTHLYYAQVVYILGEDRHAKLRPDLAEEKLLKWSKYRDVVFKAILEKQNEDGSWPQGVGFSSVGPVYTTSVYLTIMQLDKGNLPIYQR